MANHDHSHEPVFFPAPQVPQRPELRVDSHGRPIARSTPAPQVPQRADLRVDTHGRPVARPIPAPQIPGRPAPK